MTKAVAEDLMLTPSITPTKDDSAEVWAFFRSLESSRLLERCCVERLKREFSEGMEALCKMLIDHQMLTPYQLKRVRDGQPRGLVLGHYRILDELGSGGFGVVYKANHGLMNRTVALKVISPAMIQEPEVRTLFLREVVAATRLNHPNIALAYDAGEFEGTLYFAMEHIAGKSLEQKVLDSGPLPIPLACAIVLQAAQALQYAHEHGMVHRDIKPGNLLLSTPSEQPDKGGPPAALMPYQVKVIDFGLARILTPSNSPSQTIQTNGGILGTPAFMSPEQARDHHNVDIRSDLYSLGCTLYYALTARLAYAGSTTVETLALKMEGAPEPLRALRPDVPGDIEQIVTKLMAKDPEQRFQTPVELTEALGYSLWAYFLRQQAASSGPSVGRMMEKGSAIPIASVGSTSSETVCSTKTLPDQNDHVSPKEQTSKFSFCDLWSEWCDVVHSLASGKAAGARGLDYRNLHRAMMASLDEAAKAETELPLELVAQLKIFLEPWLSWDNLANLDRGILRDLSRSCAALNSRITKPRRQSRWVIVVSLIGAFATMLAAFVTYGLPLAALRQWRISNPGNLGFVWILAFCSALAVLPVVFYLLLRQRSPRSRH